eukprot:152738_1
MGNNCFTTSHVHHQEINVKNESTLKQNQCISLEEGCECINRMHSALRYYSSLNLDHSQHAENKLVKYCNMTYKLLLNDYVHIVTNHNSDTDLHKIFNLLTASDDYIECTIAKCTLSSRHYRDRNVNNINKSKVESNKDFMFYRDILDSMHCFLFHLYDFGYRIHKNELNEMKTTITKDTEDTEDITCDDNAFKLLYSSIKTKLKALKCTTNTPRHQSNKFNLNLFNNTNGNNVYSQSTKNVTFMDRVYDYLNQTCMQQSEVNKLKTFLEEEQYDTDSIMMDAKNGKHSNLKSESFNLIKDFVYQSIVTKGSFAIGFIFYYWGKKKKQIINWHKKGVEEDNINDHSGFKPSELF